MADSPQTSFACNFCGGSVQIAAPLDHNCASLSITSKLGVADVLQPPCPTAGIVLNTPPDEHNVLSSRPQSMITGSSWTGLGETIPYLGNLANTDNTPASYVSPYTVLRGHISTPFSFNFPSPIPGSGLNPQPQITSLPVARIVQGPSVGYNGIVGNNLVNLAPRNNDTSPPWPHQQLSPAPVNRLKRSILPNLSPSEEAFITRKMRESTKRFVITRQVVRVDEPIPSPCEFCRTDYPQLKENQVYEICTSCMESYLQSFKDTYVQECLILRGANEVDINDRFPAPRDGKRLRRTPPKPATVRPKPWELPNFKPPNGYIPSEVSRIYGCSNCVLRKTECWLMGATFGCCYACATYKERCIREPQDYRQLLDGSVSDDEKRDAFNVLRKEVQTP